MDTRFFCALVCVIVAGSAHVALATNLISDSMTNATQSGGLAGSSAVSSNATPAIWTSYWLNNNTGAHNTLTSPAATYPAGQPPTPIRGASGTTFTVNT